MIKFRLLGKSGKSGALAGFMGNDEVFGSLLDANCDCLENMASGC